MNYEVFHCGWLEQVLLLYEAWGSFRYFRWSFRWFHVVFSTCVLISAYLWSFGIAVSLQTSAASVSLVSQLQLLNEGGHQAPRGLPFPSMCHSLETLQTDSWVSHTVHFTCFLLGITVLHWLIYNVLKTLHQNDNTVRICCFMFCLCFLVLDRRITLVLINVGWKQKSSCASWQLEWLCQEVLPAFHSVEYGPPSYSCFPVDTALEMSLKYTLLSILY